MPCAPEGWDSSLTLQLFPAGSPEAAGDGLEAVLLLPLQGIASPVLVRRPQEAVQRALHCHSVGDDWAYYHVVDQPCFVEGGSPGGSRDGGEGPALLCHPVGCALHMWSPSELRVQ